jgi:hypothetical protein
LCLLELEFAEEIEILEECDEFFTENGYQQHLSVINKMMKNTYQMKD